MALLTADERKRRALARAVVSGLLANDDAAVGEVQFLIRAIAGLESHHHDRLTLATEPAARGLDVGLARVLLVGVLVGLVGVRHGRVVVAGALVLPLLPMSQIMGHVRVLVPVD